MAHLADLIDPSDIRLGVHADDWRQAIRAAGDVLVGAGASGDSYTAAMIENVDRHGPYIVVAPGFAFAHSRPDDSVRRTAMSVVRLASPVAFGHDTNDPVGLVVALAAVDSDAHQEAMAKLAGLLADPARRAALDAASTPEEMHRVFGAGPERTPAGSAASAASTAAPSASTATTPTSPDAHRPDDDRATVASKGFILTVCGNGLGTSLFLKNTLESVLDRWGWGPYLRVEATDTISARGRAQEADVLFTSGAIAEALGDVGVPVEVIDDFTSTSQIDAALRRVYAV